MAVVLQIGAGGVGGVVAHKMAKNREVFSRIVLASRTLGKCQAIADSVRAKGLGEIEIESVDADNVESLVALIEKVRPALVVNVALPYQDLSIMEACLRTRTHYLDTANYEHPDSAHFEYKEQWAYDARYKEAGIFALLGSGFDPGVTNVFCAYAQKHYFDAIHSIDILDCNAGDHGYAFATNFNPEINLREVSSKARYWVAGNASHANGGDSITSPSPAHQGEHNSITSPSQHEGDTIHSSPSHAEGARGWVSPFDSKKAHSANCHSERSEESLVSQADLSLNPDLQQDAIYRKFEREEKHFALESNTQDLQVVDYAGGHWRDIAPLALMKEWDYPEVGAKNSYLLYHEELESLVRNVRGLKRIRFFMTFGESYLTHMKCLENVGLLRVDSVPHKGGSIVPIEVLKTLLPDPASLASRTKGKTNIGCYMRGVKDGKERTIYIYNVCEHEKCYEEVNAQGVSYTTGVPAMIGAKLICEGKWGVGAVKNSNGADNADMPRGGENQCVTNYWIVCCQPKKFKNQCGIDGEKIEEGGWLWSPFKENGNPRDYQHCFENMAIGDSVLCYVSLDKDNGGADKIQAFRAVFSICDKDDEAIYLKFQNSIDVKAQDLSERIVDLYRGRGKYSAFTELSWGETGNNWFNGSFFKTTKGQFEGIVNTAMQLKANIDMPKGGEAQGVDSQNGAGVWNMEQNDPDFFMQELNKQGLPYVVLEIESNGEAKVLEDRRRILE